MPPDRSIVLTEQRNQNAMKLHDLSVDECIDAIHAEDCRVPVALKSAITDISKFVQAIEPNFMNGGRLIYVGAGTSGRLGVLDASEMPPTFQISRDRIIGIIAGGDRSLRDSSEALEDDENGAASVLEILNLTKSDALLGITAGGTTPYVLGALRIAKAIEPNTITGLLCCAPPPGHTIVDHLIFVPTGPEIITGSTRMKAGTATKLALNMISTTLMMRSGRVYENLMVDLNATNEKLRDRGARIIATLTELERKDCFELLEQANGDLKVAIIMHKRRINLPEAKKLLSSAKGRLDKVL